ncbi:hypothetical protein VCHA52P453_80171 [Vibrio chagasii]|nr:hypothetical protein VCHA52P453_80171 [Vibrio chagasii]
MRLTKLSDMKELPNPEIVLTHGIFMKRQTKPDHMLGLIVKLKTNFGFILA